MGKKPITCPPQDTLGVGVGQACGVVPSQPTMPTTGLFPPPHANPLPHVLGHPRFQPTLLSISIPSDQRPAHFHDLMPSCPVCLPDSFLRALRVTDSTSPCGNHSLLRNTREVFLSGCASPKTNQGQGMGGQAPSRGLTKPPPGPWTTWYQRSAPLEGDLGTGQSGRAEETQACGT